MRVVSIDQLGEPTSTWTGPETADRVIEAALRPPHPRPVIQDDLGRAVRVEGRAGQLIVDLRRFEARRVAWAMVGIRPPSPTLTPFHLVGRVTKVRPSELLGPAEVASILVAFAERPELPESYALRSIDAEEGAMVVLAGTDREPRPVAAWSEVAGYVDALGVGQPTGFALSRPDRHLVGVLGDGRQFVVQVRETRGPLQQERSIRRPDPDPSPVRLGTGAGGVFERDRVLDREELRVVLESLYRYEAAPPGYR